MSKSLQLLTHIQVQELKEYFKILDELNGSPGPEFTYEQLSTMVSIHGLIEEFGQGNPRKAALKHREIILRRKQRELIAKPYESDTVH